MSLGALVAAPLCLALGAAPAWWQAGALAWLLLPLGAVATVSRTGDLERGAGLSLAAWIGLALTLAAGSGAATGVGLLLIVPLEAALTFGHTVFGTDRSKGRTGIGSTVAIAVATLAALIIPLIASLGGATAGDPAILRFGDALLGPAEVYAVVLAGLAIRRHRRHHRRERAGQDQARDFAELSNDVPIRLDRSGLVIDASPAARRLFGIGARELLGRGLFDHVHVADRPAYLTLVADAADGHAPRSVTIRLRTGTTVSSDRGAFREPVFAWTDLCARRSPATGDAASPTILMVLRDVTAHVRMEEALREAEQESRRSETGRTLFLANVSHELRTPLNAIIGFADMLASEDYGPRDPVKQREYAAIIRQSGQHLLSMVNTILDASKIEAGSFSISPEPFDLVRLIHSCCDMIGLKAESSAVEMVRDVVEDMPEVVGDQRAYKQILLNLLSNAVKFTPAGGRVMVSAHPEGNSVVLAVADTGVGISGGDLPKVGAPFFQAQNSYDRAFDGTGLGLSVVRGLVGLHGGSMTIESAPGQGTRVAVRLPYDCRTQMGGSTGQTKIETIPRYVPAPTPQAALQDGGRIHKLA